MFKQMQYFIAVVDTQSFTRAAELYYISQSAISQQIKALEEELGAKLLIRKRKSFSLTPAGEYFYQHCQEILQDVDELCKKTRELEEDENILKVGYLRGYEGKEFKDAVLDFASLYPDVTINIIKGNHEELYKHLMDETVDLAISDQRRSFHDDFINYHLLHMDCCVELSLNNPLSKEDILDVKDLRKENCILVATPEQQAIEQEFYENIIGLKCKYLFANDIDEGRLMVMMNRGIMPIEHVKMPKNEKEGIKTIPLYRNQKLIQRNYCAFWKKEKSTYYIEEFADMMRKKFKISHQE